MGLTIPPAMEVVLQDTDNSATPLDEGKLWSALRTVVPDLKNALREERIGAFAELAAWRFMRGRVGAVMEPWGIYWAPLVSGTLADGKTPFYDPDVTEVDEEILVHWMERAASAKHPVIRARYADLAWEIGRYLKRPAKDRQNSLKPPITLAIPVTLAQAAVDAYLDAVERSLADDEHHSWTFLDRAIWLSISLKDKIRSARSKAALFTYYRKMASGNGKFMWWQLDDLTEDRARELSLDEIEHGEIIQSLEAALHRYSDIKDKDYFDPHAAKDAADRLIQHYRNSPEEVRRVIKQAGAAFEEFAKGATGILAIAWLEDLIPRYRNVGLIEDAARIERAIRDRAEQARGEITRTSVPLDIPKEELDKLANAIVGSKLQEALGNIAINFMVRKESTQKTVLDMADKTPLLSRISTTIMGADGFTNATIKSVEDDLEGRVIQHAADGYNLNGPFLYFVLNRTKEKYGYDLDAIVAHISGAPFFAPSREALLREGLAAWIAEDSVKAIHVLVPQVEAACRDLLAALGAPIEKHDPKIGGFKVIGMGEVLNNPMFRQGVPQDIRFHLTALYSDPRGINLRNNLAHGIAHISLLGMGLTNWVVHSILLLSILRMNQRSAESSDNPSTPT